MNKVGSSVTWMLSVSTGQLLATRITREQQMINKPRIMRVTRIERDMVPRISGVGDQVHN
jgi:hypothetical protein